MNPLTHAYFSLELFKEEKLSRDEKDHLIIGSILPDIHISGLIQFQKTHTQGLKFFHSVENPLHKYLALGIILHGEEPKGLDFYTHNGGGYIKRKQVQILPIAKRYKKQIGKLDEINIHHLVEFSVEALVAEKNPEIVSQVLTAFKNPKINSAITAFSNFFSFSERKNRKIISLLNNKHLHKFFNNFSLPETTSQSWHSLTFFLNLSEGKNLPLREKIKKMTKFSYYNLKTRLSHKKTNQMFQEINSCLRKDMDQEFVQIKQKLVPLKREGVKLIR